MMFDRSVYDVKTNNWIYSTTVYDVDASHRVVPDLKHLHHKFYHSTAGELSALLHCTDPTRTFVSVLQTLESINQSCKHCRAFLFSPSCFRSYILSEELAFNEKLAMDLMWLDNGPVLHVVCTCNKLQGAALLRSKHVEDEWDAVLECWDTLYTGMPKILRVDE